MSGKMKVLCLTGILLVIYACRTNGVPITYDFTDPLNAIRTGNLSIDEFSTNIKTHFGNLTMSRKLSVAYSPDCNIFVECGSTMNDAVRILQDVKEKLLSQKVDIQHLSFRFRIDMSALQTLKNPMNQTKLNVPAGSHDIIFYFPNGTTCDELQNVTLERREILFNSSNWVSPDSVGHVPHIGVGYNENLIGCPSLEYVQYKRKYLLTSFSLRNTPCVIESFGYFKKRMDDLHAKNIEFTDINYQFSFIDYSSTPNCLGDEFPRHLLEMYWKRYKNNKIGATIPMPFGRLKIPTKKIIPYIDAESCYDDDCYPWYKPAALETLSRYFGAVVLTHDEWKMLQSNGSARNGKLDIRLDLFIDYTDWLLHNPDNLYYSEMFYNWSNVEKGLIELDKTNENSLQNVKVTTMIFPVTASPTTENFFVNVNTGFARRMSSKLQIGCAFQSTSFTTSSNSTSSAVVAACKQVNGSLYTLQSHFILKAVTKVSKENNPYFENVFPKLEEMRKFKEEISVLHPQATIYFQLRFELEMVDNQSTAICNSEVFSLNEYIEVTVNWAAFNGIPLIMGRAFDDNDHNKYQTWFSVITPIETEMRNYFNPHFVLRNSPKILADAEIEPCLEWTVQRPIVTYSYFYNNYVGSTFPPFAMPKDKPITQEEYKMLLQFIFHRFDLVMVRVRTDTYKDIIIAINTLVSEGLMGTRKTFIISYRYRGLAVGDEMLRDFNEFLNFTKVTLGSNISLLKAIVFGWWHFIDGTEWEKLNLTTSPTTTALELGQKLNLDVGVVLETFNCQDPLVNATSRKIQWEALNTATYLICTDGLDLKKNGNPKYVGTLLDTHLYVKIFFQDFNPNLNVYFKILLYVGLTEATMSDYLILLSHFQKFAAIHNLSYIMVDAFDDIEYKPSGWWKISNYSNLSLTSVYEEKYSAFNGYDTWRPSPRLKPNLTTNTANENHTANDNKNKIFLGVTTSGFVLMIVFSGFLYWYYKNKVAQYLSNEEEKEFYNGKEGAGEEQTAGDSEYLKFDKKFELTFADVFIDPKDLLGRGNFGTVYKGLVKEEPVAIKRPNENCPATSFKSVLCEVKLLCYIGTHPNVIQFVGAYTKEIRKGILYIATELCSNGSLDGLLRAKKRVISNMGDADNETIGTEDEDAVYSHDLHRFAKEIASGMDYIAGKNVIHGDLSARNVLLDENFTCKIGDFGLSRKLYEYLEYVKQSQEPLPWKWMAYESLKNMHFTSKSDVWSYGVTLWEIYSLGSVPYGGLSWTAGYADDLKNGLRLQMPEYATEEIYRAMLSCWELEADKRPTFTDMVDFFKPLFSSQYTVLEI